MGRLYRKTESGDSVIAYFENGRVMSRRETADININYNSIGQIYRHSQESGDHIVANCDIGGNIRKSSGAHGAVLAFCQDGIIYEGNQPGNRILALFDGDMYGAAAAVVAKVLRLGEMKERPGLRTRLYGIGKSLW